MGKPKRNNQKDSQMPKKSKKKVQLNRMNSSDDQQVQDVMAWGRKKENYYRQDQEQYSQLSEQQKQAKKIYENQYQNYLNDQDLYQIPKDKQYKQQTINDLDENIQQDQQEKLPSEYINQQLQWVIQLFKDLQYYMQNDLLPLYQSLLKSYLATIISIKQLQIPYIKYHPIIPLAVNIKTKIMKLMKKLAIKKQNQEQDEKNQNYGQQEDEQKQENESNQFQQDQQLSSYPDHCQNAIKQQNNQHKKGLEFYQQMKKKQQQNKKLKKKQKKLQRQISKKPAFKSVNQNQGRFASELILKNKGLIKKRKKTEGNSRVKLRKKFEKKKALHRAKTGHFIRQNPGRAYQGQANIKTGKLSGVRLK